MGTPDLDHLADHLDVLAASLQLRAGALAGAEPAAAEHWVSLLGEAQARIDQRAHEVTELAASALAHRLALSATELHVIWLLVAVAMRRDVRTLVASCSGETTADPSLDAIRGIVFGDRPSRVALDELGPRGRLRTLRLIERSDRGGDVHDSRQTWAISRRILAWLHGGTDLEVSADRAIRAVGALPALDDLAMDARSIEDARSALRGDEALVIATGLPGLGRRTLLALVAREAGFDVLELDARKLARDRAELRTRLCSFALECRLLGRLPMISNLDALAGGTDERLDVVAAELPPLLEGRVLATTGTKRTTLPWDRPVVMVEVQPPSTAQRAALWLAALAGGTPEDGALLAEVYPLAPALIRRAAAAARAHAAGAELTPTAIAAGIRSVLDDGLEKFAKRVTVTQTWNDLVLPQDQIDAIVELMARVRGRSKVYEQWGFAAKVGKGLGLSALFSGPPGTGKTMVAALIARDLGLELYQVDLGKVVSKYIGETEKHLGELFDAAEAGHAILLFDEADALFGKRTDVKSSNDRYANLETNYLLQRLESFTGICLLTSNHDSYIDPAYQRRLSLHVRFELPDESERAHLWSVVLAGTAPVEPDVDFGSLGRRYAMSGGYIRNAALRAAFLAADDGTAISANHLERAARVEYEGMGKIAA